MTALTPQQRHAAAIWTRDPHECALSPKYTRWPGDDSKAGPCADDDPTANLQADHILKYRLILKRRDVLAMTRARGIRLDREAIELVEADPDDLIADERNGWLLCPRHHPLKDRKLIVLIAEVILPDHYFGFVTAYGLTSLHDREFQRPARQERSRRDGAPARHR